MPREGQQTVTIPTYIWNMASNYYRTHEKELRSNGIKSTSALIAFWIQQSSFEQSTDITDTALSSDPQSKSSLGNSRKRHAPDNT